MSLLQTVTYQEELYKIHTKVLVVIPRSWAQISEDEKTLLNKILGSVKQSIAKVDIVTLETFSPEELSAYGASRIISFGSALKGSSKLYENLTIGQSQIIVAEDFPLLDDAKKKSLWGSTEADVCLVFFEMIEPRIIRERYSSMSDDQLIAFAQNELTSLTDDAVKILYDEFQSRGLDGSSYFSDEFRARAQSAAIGYSFNERKKGKQDELIIADLMHIGLSDDKAIAIVKRLPRIGYKNEQFEKLITKGGDNVSIKAAIARIFIFGFSGYLILMGIGRHFPTFTIMGIIFAVLGIYTIFSSKDEIKGGKYWITLIYENPIDIVWIKPIIAKHTIGYVFTMFKIQHFQFLTKDRRKIALKIDTKEEQEIFFEGVSYLLPHAQIGYTEEINDIYEENSLDFINELQAKHLYTPIDYYRN